jgi:pectate lyase-like protein
MHSESTLRSNRSPFCAAFVVLFALSAFSGMAATWYVATNGLDTNPGSSNSPFATIMRAQSAASFGDTVYLRGGTYYLNSSHLTVTNAPWAVVNYITNNGVNYIGYPGELPVFDFSAVAPYGFRTTAFQISASNCVFKSFDVVGVPVVITNAGTQSECFRVKGGSNNRFELLRMHDGHGIGFYLTEGSSNLVLNCDAWNNTGFNSFSHGNIDGFGFHPEHSYSTGNIIRGCRAWFNSDDGYDLIHCYAVVVMENCWAFYNGYFTNFTSTGGNANGFKSGGFGVGSSAKPYPIPPPRHVTRFCLAVGNRASGFHANFHPDGLDWINNTAFRNGTDYSMVCNTNTVSRTNDTPGFNHLMRNNLGFIYSGTNRITWLDTNKSDVAFNYFTLPVNVGSNDFMSLDERLLTAPRRANGDLPYIAFAQLVSSSDLMNAGTNADFAFAGAAPDLGAFEYGGEAPPLLALSRSGTNLIFTGSGGPAGGTNYLVGTTNLTSPLTEWSRVQTNGFDLTGTFVITNSIPGGTIQRFYRIGLP